MSCPLSSKPGDRILLLNKPHGVLSKFSDDQGRPTLKSFVDLLEVYPIGRLDADSEGLLLLTDRKSLVAPLLAPGGKTKRYLVCVEGVPSAEALERLRTGLLLKDGPTLPAQARQVTEPDWLWPRPVPIRYRKSVPTSWLEIAVREGRNRQVRRMTAAVGLPTLRLVRVGFGPIALGGLASGCWREVTAQEYGELIAWERGCTASALGNGPPGEGSAHRPRAQGSAHRPRAQGSQGSARGGRRRG